MLNHFCSINEGLGRALSDPETHACMQQACLAGVARERFGKAQ